MKKFRAPRKSFQGIDAEGAADLIAGSADISLVLDRKGVVRDVAFGTDDFAAEFEFKWQGAPWADLVTVESRPKVEALLRDAADSAATRWRQINHTSARGADVPVLYTATALGSDGRTLVLGRDLRPMAAIQQRLFEAEKSLERDYSRLRHAETRYRLLFQVSSEPVLILDAATSVVEDANPAAGQALREQPRKLVGSTFPEGFDAASTRGIRQLLTTVRATGRPDDVKAKAADGSREFIVSASVFRQDNTTHFLVRLAAIDAGVGETPHRARSRLLDVVEQLPDGLVVTAPDGRILTANRAFLDLAQLATEEQARNESLERWLGRPGVDLGVMIANLRQQGSVRLFSTTLRGEYGTTSEVEISAVSVTEGAEPCYGFTIRNVGRRFIADTRAARELPRSVEQLTELVGRVSLKELVRETTDVIERLCIEAALELTRDNRASAAEMLGLSRQSLYVKLRRYGLGDLDDGDRVNGRESRQ